MPPVNDFKKIDLKQNESKFYPTELLYCPESKLFQLGFIVNKNILFPKSSHFFLIITFPKQNKETATTQNSDTPVLINKLIGKNKIKKKEKLMEFINKIKLNFLLLI